MVGLVKEYKAMERTIFSSFHHKSMLKVRGIEEQAKVAFLYSDGMIDAPGYLEKHKVAIAHPSWHLLDRGDSLDAYHEKGIMVNVWTVDSGSVIRRLCDSGVDGIITNKPDLGSEIRDDKLFIS